MKQNVRKVSLLTLVAVFVVAIIIGFASILPKTPVIAEETTISTSKIIGEKTDNVTVSVAQTKGEYTGLLVARSNIADTWSAKINSLFVGDTSLSYLLPDGRDPRNSNDTVGFNGNAFTVNDVNGNFVLTVVVGTRGWAVGYGFAYVYNGSTYTIPHSAWTSEMGDYYTGENKLTEFDQIAFIQTGTRRSILPQSGITATASVGLASAEGTLTFDYDEVNQKMTVYTTTADIDGVDEPKVGSGTVVAVGSRDYDLSNGYTITMHNITSFGTIGEDNYYPSNNTFKR